MTLFYVSFCLMLLFDGDTFICINGNFSTLPFYYISLRGGLT